MLGGQAVTRAVILGLVAVFTAAVIAAIWWGRERRHAVSCLRHGFLPIWSPDSRLRSWILLDAMTEIVREDAATAGGVWEDEDGQEYEVGPLTVALVAEHRLKAMHRARLAATVRARERGGLEDRP